MVHGYIQFNNLGCGVENQRGIIKAYAAQHDLEVENWIEDGLIRDEANYKSEEIDSLLKPVSEGDILILYDISLLGSCLNAVTDLVSTCMRKKVQVWTINDNRKFGNNNDYDMIANALQFCDKLKRDLEEQED